MNLTICFGLCESRKQEEEKISSSPLRLDCPSFALLLLGPRELQSSPPQHQEMASSVVWNPVGYGRFANERLIPPLDLLNRISPSIPIKCIVVCLFSRSRRALTLSLVLHPMS